MPFGPAGTHSGPRSQDTAKALVEWVAQHKTRFVYGTAFHIREDLYQRTSEFLAKPETATNELWWLEMVQKLSVTISDDDLMAALPKAGWEEWNGAWRPPEED